MGKPYTPVVIFRPNPYAGPVLRSKLKMKPYQNIFFTRWSNELLKYWLRYIGNVMALYISEWWGKPIILLIKELGNKQMAIELFAR